MIRRSLDSLQREKLEKKQKLENFKRSAFDLVHEREEKRRREKEQLRYQDPGVAELTRAEQATEQAKNEIYKQVTLRFEWVDIDHLICLVLWPME